MTSAPSRTPQRLGRLLRGIFWGFVYIAFAVGGAGLVGESFHAPGSPARAELTYSGDAALGAQLDAVTAKLRMVSSQVNELSADAKTALEEVANTDPTKLQAALADGGQTATLIANTTRDLKEQLAGLPGDGPDATFTYSNAVLVRRAAVISAIEASSGLAGLWQSVSSGAVNAGHLINLIDMHDQTVLQAAAKGRAQDYRDGAAILNGALATIAEVQQLRVKLIADAGDTVLDEWISRTSNYDKALQALYQALDASHGVVNLTVQQARRNEQNAFTQLPPDRRTIIVIVSEVARGGLTQAIVAIDDASGRIDDALGGPS